MSIRYIRQSDMARCPHVIMDPSHYRNDGTCKCDDAEHRTMMIADWGYTPDQFKDIPLRLYIPAAALQILDQAIAQVTTTPAVAFDREQWALLEAIDNLRLVWAQVGGSDVSS